ncbi:hypothetical protein TRIP_E160187 [uncultured Spirochaetota bacterium]|nr:hypothetical protein TRIP_E160187 [uncultured Spirochaetota bacterium]
MPSRPGRGAGAGRVFRRLLRAATARALIVPDHGLHYTKPLLWNAQPTLSAIKTRTPIRSSPRFPTPP